MKIVTLIENTACRSELIHEHGLSLYIEACGKRILFDAGQSQGFAENARSLGIDLRQVDFAVLSHGHYDHGGGLSHFWERNATAPVYVHSQAFGAHYNASGKYIGLDPGLQRSPRLRFVEGCMEIAPGIRLCTAPAWECGSGLQILENGHLRPDPFHHEQYLLLEEKGKLICLSGCAHKGIVPIAEHFRPDVLIGGFHLSKIDPESPLLTDTARRLAALPTVFYTGHCTGQAQYDVMKSIMGPKLHAISAGAILQI